MLQNYAISGVRTAVPAAVGWLLSWLLARGIQVPAQARDWAVGALTFGLMMAYYFAVRALEHRWPQLGWLLGVPAKPTYPQVGTKAKG
jgi:hypothetical protein